MTTHSAECLFCKITSKTEPAIILHEDELCISFMDIYPLGAGHALVIPKQHAEKLEELDDTVRHHLFAVCNHIVAAQRAAGLGVNGTHYLLNDGKATNQHVPHVHFHLIPRSGRDNAGFFGRLLLHFTGLFGLPTSRQTLQAQADQIVRHLRIGDENQSAAERSAEKSMSL